MNQPHVSSPLSDAKSYLEGSPLKFHEAVMKWMRETPDHVALTDDTRQLTYGELGKAITDASDWLVRQGVRAGDRVAVVNENCITTAVFIFAVSAAGGIVSPVNARISQREMDVILGQFAPRCVLYTTDSPAAAEYAQSANAKPMNMQGIGQFCVTFDDTAELETGDLPGVVVFTSGTTGNPKAVMQSHRSLLYQGASQVISRRLTPADSLYVVAPLSVSIGLGSNLMGAVVAGAEAILVLRFTPAGLARAIVNDLVTFVVAVPQVYAKLLDYADSEGMDLGSSSRLRVVGSGGASIDPALSRRIKLVFGLPCSNGYGCTEMTPIARAPDSMEASGDIIGVPSPGIEIKLMDKDGNEVSKGEIGELWARGPSRMMGYYKNPEASAEVMVGDGWLRSGDLVRQGDTGAYHICGRSKELIIRSGFNVYPIEVESVLNSFPGVMQSAVVGRKIEGDEEIVGFVQGIAGTTLDLVELRGYCRKNLAGYKVPAEIFQEELPIGPSGKILKANLAKKIA